MEFTLVYAGEVLSPAAQKGRVRVSTQERVQTIRKEFHNQLQELWGLPPLCRHKKDYLRKDNLKLRTTVKGGNFVFLVTDELDMYVKLDIQVLVPQKDRRFKDIDNKLKTICDALRVPTEGECPEEKPDNEENLFYCLLKDDKLIYQVAVDTDFLLYQNSIFKFGQTQGNSLWIINVKIKGNRFEFDKKKEGADYKDLIV